MRSSVSAARRALLALPPSAARAALVPVAGSPRAAETGAFFQMSAASADRAGDPAAPSDALAANATPYMRFRIPRPEAFYFGRENTGGVCRLCNEYVAAKYVNYHLIMSGARGSSLHMGREIVLDSLVYHARRGLDPASVLRSYAYVLARSPNYERIPALLPPDLSDLAARTARLTALLAFLRDRRVLDVSVNPHSEKSSDAVTGRLAVKRRLAFERLECVGDNAWGSHLAGRMMLIFADKKWNDGAMYHSFNTFRDLAETNTNLERMFDVLQLQTLLPPALRELVGDGKIKADVFEAVLGELSMKLYGHESLLHNSVEYAEPTGDGTVAVCTLVRHVLTEIYDLTLLCLVAVLAEHAPAVASELALLSQMPAMRPALDAGTTVRTRRPQFREGFRPTFTLPARLGLALGSRGAADCASDAELYGPAVRRRVRRCRPRWEPVAELQPLCLADTMDAAARAADRDGAPHAAHCGAAPAAVLSRAPGGSPPPLSPPLSPPAAAAPRVPGLGAAPVGASVLRRGGAVATCALLASATPLVPLNPYGVTEAEWRSLWELRGPALFDDTVDATVVLAQYEASCALQPSLDPGDPAAAADGDADLGAAYAVEQSRRAAVIAALRGVAVGTGGASTRGLGSATQALDLEEIKRRNTQPQPQPQPQPAAAAASHP